MSATRQIKYRVKGIDPC